MTAVVSIDFTSDYADLDAMLADGWTKVDTNTWQPGIFLLDENGVSVEVPENGDFWGGAYYERTFTGLTAGASYAVSLAVTCVRPTDPCVVGMQAHTYSTTGGGVDLLTASESRTLSVASVPAHTDGTLLVRMGFFTSSTGPGHTTATFLATSLEIDDGAAAPTFHSGLPVLGIDWDEIAYTAGVIAQSGTTIGLTRGALRFDPRETWAPLPYPGDFIAPVGVYELREQLPRFIGSILPVGPRQLAVYNPGATFTSSLGTTTVTPVTPGRVITSAEYLRNVTVTWPLLDGGIITVTFPYALCVKYGFDAENKGEVLVPVEILAVPLTTSTAPYYITVTEPAS